MLTFNKAYFFFTVLIFAIEVSIAVFVEDNFIRPHLGDVLVVILIYCFLKSFLRLSVLTTAMLVLIFSFSLEFLQYLKIVEKLGLENSRIARTILGTSFDWMDLMNYMLGIVMVILIERYWLKNETGFTHSQFSQK
ncbi:MAG TPA: DUF2809 domain-containing protein [Gillisia sp.]|nr:DUF2809 domain-containing protein [Gillisia sp.]